jgi:hypothetical protein
MNIVMQFVEIWWFTQHKLHHRKLLALSLNGDDLKLQINKVYVKQKTWQIVIDKV